MKLQRLLLITGIVGATAFSAQAQQRNQDKDHKSNEQQLAEEIGLERLSIARELPLNSRNLSAVLQDGNDNLATSIQRNTGLLSNQVSIAQVGDFNVTEALQVGSNNRTLVKQNGNLNLVRSEITGRNNQTGIAQNGNENKVIQLFNANNQVYNIVQNGSENVLEQRGVSAAAPQGYDIKMEGNGIQIKIEQSRLP